MIQSLHCAFFEPQTKQQNGPTTKMAKNWLMFDRQPATGNWQLSCNQVDLGHGGLDNAFLIDTGDPIAQCRLVAVFVVLLVGKKLSWWLLFNELVSTYNYNNYI